MKTYKEYYQIGLSHHLDWKSKQEEEWWRRNELKGKLNLEGDYIETINVLSEYEKNDSSLFTNHTNVKNSEWCILFSMLGQALVDWCRENVDYENLWSFGVQFKRGINEYGATNYIPEITVKKMKEKTGIEEITDETVLKKFEDCEFELCRLVDTFLYSHGKNIPNDWNIFSFGLDSLYESCKWGEWICASDGYMTFGNLSDPDKRMYDEYVLCM